MHWTVWTVTPQVRCLRRSPSTTYANSKKPDALLNLYDIQPIPPADLTAESCKASVRLQLAEHASNDSRDVLSVDAVAQWLDTANTKRLSLETSETTPTPRMDRQPTVDTTH